MATIALHRPSALKAITVQMLEELAAALDDAGADPDVRLIVLTETSRAFSAGVDLKALHGRTVSGGGVGDLLDLPAREVTRRLTTLPKVVIERVNGFCFMGALELVLACDLVVAADEATFSDTHAKFGLRPTWGMSQRLVRAVGITRARTLSYTARSFSGRDAVEWGLATMSVPLADLDQAVADLAWAVLANSAVSLAAYKDLYRRALELGVDAGLEYEARTNTRSATPMPGSRRSAEQN